jgi:hypothetical protein
VATPRTNSVRIAKALELEILAQREVDPVWAARFRRSARTLRKFVARKCSEKSA